MRGSILLLMGIAACGSDHTTNIKPTLRLADQDDATLARLISAAGGTDMFGAEAQLSQFSSAGTDPCPAVAISGNSVTLTGGCTTQAGIAIAGSATLTNPVGWDSVPYNYQSDQTYDLNQFSLTQQSYTQSYDGMVRISNSDLVEQADISSTQLGIALRSDIYFACSREGTTSLSCQLEGSGLELIGVGGVTVGGSVNASTSGSTSSFTIRGIDTMTVTVSAGCVAWQISGTARQKVCQ